MFIQTEDTPNPNALKFLPDCEIVKGKVIFFNNAQEAEKNSPLATKIFRIGDISAVFLGSDFITVTKIPDANWDVLKPEILMCIMDHLVSGLPVTSPNNKTADAAANIDASEIEKQIIEIIETRVRPSVAMDGGDIIFKEFRDGIVYLTMQGACSGCPSSSVTLKNGIESMLQHFVPEVIEVREA